jgi:parallel beta-helix repeat protein
VTGPRHTSRAGDLGASGGAATPPARRRARTVLTLATALALAVLALMVLGQGVAQAATDTWYVDNGAPNCSDTGPGTAGKPFCTITAGAGKAVAGQTVQVASGTYNETVSAVRSGSAGAPITFRSAPGATVTVTGGSANGRGFSVSSKSWITITGFSVTGTAGAGFYLANATNLTVTGNHVSNAGDAGNVQRGFYLSGTSDATVSGNTADHDSGAGMYISNGANVTVSGNNVSYSGQPVQGLTARGVQLNNMTNSTVSGNTVHHNSDSGIYLAGETSGVLVVGNEAYANAQGYQRAAPGIDLRSTGNTVAGNFSHDNEDSGIQSYTGAGDTLIIDNLCSNNGDHGIDDLNAPGQRIIGNTVWKNVTAGINLEGSSSGGTIVNNISVENGVKSPRTSSNIRVDPNSVANTTVDSNLVYLNQPGVMYIWGTTGYASLATFKAATGQEPHGIQASPGWVSPSSGDFHLTAGSRAIDSADSGVSGQPATDYDGHGRVDDPATPDTGIGPRSYDDRGAFEFIP